MTNKEKKPVGRPRIPENKRRVQYSVCVSPETLEYYRGKPRGLAGHHLDAYCHDLWYAEEMERNLEQSNKSGAAKEIKDMMSQVKIDAGKKKPIITPEIVKEVLESIDQREIGE